MNTSNIKWKPLTIPFNNDLNDTLQQQHHAAQFIALVGHHLITQQPDDSNTNMEHVSYGDKLLGNTLPNGLRVALQLTDLRISILGKDNNAEKEIDLDGKTKQEVFDELKQSLSDLDVEVVGFKNEMHYEMPAHQLNKGAAFSVHDKQYFIENALYRHNAEIVLHEIAKDFEQAEPVKIWPHHFDTGSFFPVSRNDKGELTKSIGIGWTIPDSMVNEPYYYLSFWSEKPMESLEEPSPLDAGEWMMPVWNGAILKHSEIIKQTSAETQFKLVESFFYQGLGILLNR